MRNYTSLVSLLLVVVVAALLLLLLLLLSVIESTLFSSFFSMALEVVGGAFLSSVFQNLFDQIASSDVISFFGRKTLDEALLRGLENQLLLANAVVDDAETKQLGNRLVREWLHELKAATYDAEDLMIEIGHESLRCEMEEGESSSRPRKVMKLASSMFSYNASVTKLESKIGEILDRLKFLLDKLMLWD